MISSNDRSGYIGASDTSYVVGNWNTKSFKQWWLTKLGLLENDYTNKAMRAGNEYEHKIADALGLVGKKDWQVIFEDLRLRVNFDFETEDTIYEIKTYREDKGFKVSKAYWRQAQVEMFARNKKLCIVSYPLTDEEYNNFFLDVDPKKIKKEAIKYDKKWIENEYLPKLKILTNYLERGAMPLDSVGKYTMENKEFR